MMKKKSGKSSFWRILLITMIGMMVIGGLALAIVPQFIPWDKVKTQAEDKLSALINHQVEIKTISFNIFKGIELKGIAIANGKGFSEEPILKDELATVNYRLLPLLFGKVVVKALVLKQPQLVIEKHAQGHFNFSDMIKKKNILEKDESKPEKVLEENAIKRVKEPVKLPFDILVSHVGIVDATLIYRDLGKKQEYKLEAFNFKVDNLTLAGLTPINVLLTTNIHAMGKTIPLKFKTDWRFNYKQQQVFLDAVLLNIPGISFEAEGKIDQVLSDPTLDITGGAQLSFKTMIAELIPDEVKKKLPKDFDVNGPVNLSFNLQGPVKALDKLEADFNNQLDLAVKAAGQAISLGIKGNIKLENNMVQLKQEVLLPGIKTVLSGTVKQIQTDPLMNINLNNQIILATLFEKVLSGSLKEKLPPLKVKGSINVKSNLAGLVKKIKTIDFSTIIDIKGVEAVAKEMSVLKSLNGKILISPKQVNIKSFKGQLSNEPLNFTLKATGFDIRDSSTLKPENLKATIDWSLTSEKLNLDALMALVPKKDKKEKTASTKETEQSLKINKSELPEPDARKLLPKGLVMQGKANLGGVVFGAVKLGAISMTTNIRDRLSVTKVKLSGYKGVVKNSTRLNFTKKRFGFDVDSSIKGVDIEPLLNDVVDTFVAAKLKKPGIIKELKDKITGRLTGSVNINGRGMRVNTVRSSMQGKGNVKLLGSRLRKFGFQEQLAKWVGNDKFNQDIPFDRVIIKFDMGNEIVNVKTFIADSGPKGLSGDLRMTAEGKLSFKATYERFRIHPRISPRAAVSIASEFRQYTEVLKDKNGWINLPMILNGPLKKPDVKPDWDWIKKQFSNYARKKMEKATQATKKKAEEFINKNKGKSADEVKRNAGKELEKAKDSLKKLNLNNLFK